MVFVIFLIAAAALGLAFLLRPWPLFAVPDDSPASNRQAAKRSVASDFRHWVELQARARGLSVRGVARPIPVECPKCRKASNYFIYPDELCERCWQATLKPLSPTPVKHTRL